MSEPTPNGAEEMFRVRDSARGWHLQMFTIYCDPKDHPGKYVTRRWVCVKSSDEPVARECVVTDDLQAARDVLPRGLIRFPAQEGDDPCIVETWV